MPNGVSEARFAAAWAARRANFPDEITFSVPGSLHYDAAFFTNRRDSFAVVSVTGTRCALRCEHCHGKLLSGMLPAETPEALVQLGTALAERGCSGVLLSGGCDPEGRVPLAPYLGAVERLKGRGLTVLAHSGLVARTEARALRRAGVDQVLLDVIGDRETARAVYHLDKGPEEYLRVLSELKEEGLSVAPHVVVGLHFGELRGERFAIEEIGRREVDRLVLVALKPLPGTRMAGRRGPGPEETAELAAWARLRNPRAQLSFGCARPYGPSKLALERYLVDAGVNALAFPADETVRYAEARGLRYRFAERCCSMV
ncbi:MAG: radical SAM protein [Deltaproteobacteria bacterium]|nr:radical SAM protein [Deltaproteobacteria bacterium]